MNKRILLLLLLWSPVAAYAEWNAGCGNPPPPREIEVIGTPASANTGAAVANNLNVTATCPSGSQDVIAIACVATHKPGATAVGLGTVTWAGTSMLPSVTAADTATDGSFVRMYHLYNPLCDDLPHTLTIPATPTSLFMSGHITFFKNVMSPSNLSQSTGTTGTPTITVPSQAGNVVVDCVAARNSNTNLVVGPGQTLLSRNETTNATASTNEEGGQSYEPGAASVVMSWTGTSSASWASTGTSLFKVSTLLRHKK